MATMSRRSTARHGSARYGMVMYTYATPDYADSYHEDWLQSPPFEFLLAYLSDSSEESVGKKS